MATSLYSEALKKLLSINMHGGIKPGLDNTHLLSQALHHPHKKFKTVHVAGTNGKGSVTTKIAKGLEIASYRVGLYTSPHLSCFRERIQINGMMISEERALYHLTHIFSLMEKENILATFFEVTTLLAFCHFESEGVDIAVIETGLGGRLDATNIITPILSVITSISLEHTEFLGTTIESITLEKGGIIKPLVPVVIGPKVTFSIIEKLALTRKSPVYQVTGNFVDYHKENNAIATKALKILNLKEEVIEKALLSFPPCRFETIFFNSQQKTHPITLILDVAHNPDGLKYLLQAIHLHFPSRPFRLMIALSSNKDIENCLKVMAKETTHFHLVEAPSERAISTDVMYNQLLHLNVPSDKITCEKSPVEGLKHMIEEVEKTDELIVIAGTFFIMNPIRKFLNIDQPQDPFDLNERSHSLKKVF